MEVSITQKLLTELSKLAREYNIKLSPDLKLGIKVSQDPQSINGEKTKESIIDKMYRRVMHDGNTDYTILDIPDLIRTTAVVEDFTHVPHFLDMMKARFPDMTGKRPIYPKRGYKGTHLDYCVDGLLADTQIVSPIQGIVDSFTHQLYSKIRNLPENSPERKRLENLSKNIYDLLFESSNFMDNDLVIRSKFIDYGKRPIARSASNMLPENLAKQLNIKPYTIKNNSIVFDKPRLEDQAEMMQDYAMEKQAKLVAINKELFGQYNKRKQQSIIETTLTKNQWNIYSRYCAAIKIRQNTLDAETKGHGEQYFKDNYGEEIKRIEDERIFPDLSK